MQMTQVEKETDRYFRKERIKNLPLTVRRQNAQLSLKETAKVETYMTGMLKIKQRQKFNYLDMCGNVEI